jgi:hypothetical protein
MYVRLPSDKAEAVFIPQKYFYFLEVSRDDSNKALECELLTPQ